MWADFKFPPINLWSLPRQFFFEQQLLEKSKSPSTPRLKVSKQQDLLKMKEILENRK
jgi:hypothetical protein